nr:sugar phosphate nucleotidyltransferase [Paenibacillus sp. JMULE4]
MTWKDILISPHTQIIKALEIIDAGAMRFAIVVDEKYRLVGTLTDGDIRRGILRGVSLDSSVSEVMNVDPISFSIHDDKQKIISVMKRKKLQQIPILDDDGCVVSLELLTDILESDKRENWVILMAGGLGSRLSPLTDDCPKPLLKVGSKPILENIIDNFISQGFYKFYLSVNYKAEMIKEYFGDGTKWGIEIHISMRQESLGRQGL